MTALINIRDKFLNYIKLFIYNISPSKGLQQQKNGSSNIKVIVSLTSFPDRIDKVWICIESILRQQVKPDRIILWLAESEFKDMKIPISLLNQTKKGLEIRYCDNLLSYKKIFYTYKHHSDSIIVTVDDDTIYPKYFLKKLLKRNAKYPKEICCFRAHEMMFDSNNKLMPYLKWNRLSTTGYQEASYKIVATGVGGILYPPHVFSESLWKKDVFTRYAPYSDDLWLKIISMICNIKIIRATKHSKTWPLITDTQSNKLCKYNVADGGNDKQFAALIDYYNVDVFELAHK